MQGLNGETGKKKKKKKKKKFEHVKKTVSTFISMRNKKKKNRLTNGKRKQKGKDKNLLVAFKNSLSEQRVFFVDPVFRVLVINLCLAKLFLTVGFCVGVESEENLSVFERVFLLYTKLCAPPLELLSLRCADDILDFAGIDDAGNVGV